MRIFVLSRDPRANASLHVDADVLQRCFGLAQVLASVHRDYRALTFNASKSEWQTASGRKTYAPLKTDVFIEWASQTAGNYAWVRRQLRAFLDEYQHRWGDAQGKRHKAWEVYESLKEPPSALRAAFLDRPEAMTAFVTQGEFPDDVDVVDAHRQLYRKKRHTAPTAYANRSIPPFMLEA